MRGASFDRAETLDAIMRAFWEHGYEATSIGVLEAATGLKRQSLYNAFGNKDAMFNLALDAYRRKVAAPLESLLDSDSPAEAIPAFFRKQADILLDPDNPSGCLVAGGQQELANRAETVGQELGDMMARQSEELVERITAWQRAGKFDADLDPGQVAALLMAQTRGMAVLGRAKQGVELVRAASEGAAKAFAGFLA